MASLEGVLANIPGLSGYLAQGQYNQQQGAQGLQTVGTLIQLQNALRKQQEDQAFKAVLAESGGDIEKALPKLIQSGHIKDAAELAPLIKMKRDEESNAAFRKQFQEGGGNYTPEMLRTMGRYNFERGNHAAAAPLFSEADRMEKVATEKSSLTGMKSLPAVPAVGEQGPNIPQPGQPGAVPDFLLKSKYVNTSAQALQDRINRGLIPSASAAEGELSRLATAHNAMAQAEAMQNLKTEQKITTAGGRESVYIQRMMMGANQAAKDVANIVQLPLSVSTGILGGRKQGPGLIDATKEVLANKVTGQEAQAYQAMSAGFQRSLAQIEAAGLMPSGSLTHQMDAVLFKEGDFNSTKMHKLAQIRQIVEGGMEIIDANPRVSPQEKAKVISILNNIKNSVPFTHSDVIKLTALQAVNPKATMKDVIGNKTSVFDAADAIINGGR